MSLAYAPQTNSSTQSAVRTYLPWVACIGLLALTGLFIRFVGGGLENDSRRVLFSFIPVTITALAGGLGVFLAARTGFPAAWDRRVSNRIRFVYPLALGIGLGVVSIGLELLTGGVQFFLELMELDRFHAPLPGSVLFYSAGAIVLEVVYRLLPITLLLWLAMRLGLAERHRVTLFWVLALISSLVEPLGQTAAAIDAGRLDIAASQFALGFFYNLAQAFWFLRGGLLAALSLRWGHYAIWHVLYGGIICAC